VEFALSNLALKQYTGNDVGRITRGAQECFWPKVILTRGEYGNAQIQLNSIVGIPISTIYWTNMRDNLRPGK